MAENVGSVEVDVDANTRTLEAQIRRSAARAGQSFGDLFSRSSQRSMTQGMDRTVKLVLKIIATMGPQVATLASGMAAAFTGIVSSAIIGVGGALLALGGPLIGAATGAALLVTAWEDMVEQSSALQGAIDGLSEAWSNQAAALAGQVAPALSELLGTLGEVVANSNIGEALGQSLATIAGAFDAVLTSPGFTAFVQAMQTTIPEAVSGFGAGIAGLTQGLAQLFAAAGPAAVQLAEMFSQFGQTFATTMQEMAASGQLASFFDSAVASIQALTGFLGPLAQALGNVFLIGTDAGNRMLETLGGLAEQFLAFTQSAQGAQQIQQWFTAGQRIFEALLPVIGAVGTALSQMVTPQLVSNMVMFLDDVAAIVPVVGELLSVIGDVGVLEIFGEVLRSIAEAIQPALPALSELAQAIGGALMGNIQALSPVFTVLGDAIGQIAPILTPLITQMGSLLAPLLSELAPLFSALVQAALPLVELIAETGGQLISALLPAFQEVLAAITALAPSIVALFVAFNPILRVVQLLSPVLVVVVQVLAQLMTWIAQGIQYLADFLNPIIQIVAEFIAFRGILKNVTSIFQTVVSWFGRLGTLIGGAVSNALNTVINLFRSLATRVPQFVQRMVGTVVNWFQRLGSRIGTAVSNMVQSVIRFFQNLWNTVTTAVSNGVSAVVRFFSQLPGRAIGAISSLAGRISRWVSDVFSRMRNGVTSGIDAVIDFFRGMPDRILNALAGAATLLYNVGEDIVNGLLNGLKAMWGTLTSWLGDAVSGLASGAAGILGIGSPSKVFHSIGEDTVRGLRNGLESQIPGLQRTMRNVSGTVLDEGLTSLGTPGLHPSLRRLGAGGNSLAGSFSAGRMVNVQPGAITIAAPQANPNIVASKVLDRIGIVVQSVQ